MGEYVLLPLTFAKFWFLEAPVNILHFFGKLNKAFFDLFSLPLLVRTFFQPLKNEYREGLVRFSIVVGVFVKTALIFANIILLVPLLLLELSFLILFLVFPLSAFVILFL